MAGNVLLGIMPAQKGLVTAVEKGESPDPSLSAFAKLRSTHNNYFTLPLIFIMISNHYPMTYTHDYNWVVLSAIGAISAFARHFFNLRHRKVFKPMILVVAAVLLIALATWMTPAVTPALTPHSDTISVINDEQAMQIVSNRCTGCHATNPTITGFTAPPAGIVLETKSQVLAVKAQFITVTDSKYMPLGNLTQMTNTERTDIIQWLSQL